MTFKQSLSWLPRVSSKRGRISFGSFSKILSVFLLLLFQIFAIPIFYSQVFGQTSGTKVSIVHMGVLSTSTIVGIVGGQEVPLDVRVDDVADIDGLAAHTFKLKYDPNLISVGDTNNDYIADAGTVAAGPFLGSTGKKTSCSSAYIDIDPASSALRLLTFTCVTLGLTPPAPTGSGVLATIKFKTTNNVGSQTLTLTSTQLADNSKAVNLIPHSTVSVFFQNAPCADFNGDNTVRISDILYVTGKYGTSDVDADLNGDGIVLINDVLIAVAQYWKNCP